MESVVRNVSDLPADERRIYESILGQRLFDNQQVIVQLVNNESSKKVSPIIEGASDLLEPYAIWMDLYDDEIDELESAILDRSASRPT